MAKLIDITDSEQAELALEFAESIHAGFPSPAADHAGERINLARELTPHPETTFYAHVEGDSMRDAGILDGDLVVVDRSLDPKNGDFIVAYIDGSSKWMSPASALGSYRTIPISSPYASIERAISLSGV